MSLWVCVDASVLLKLVVAEPDSDLADALWRSWIRERKLPVAPPLLPFEITSVLRKHVYRGTLHLEEGREALTKALSFDVMIVRPPRLHRAAWDMATRLNLPAAYDAYYLALAEMLGCEFWTADKKLRNMVKDSLP